MGRIQNELLGTASNIANTAIKVPVAMTAVNEIAKNKEIKEATAVADKKLEAVKNTAKQAEKLYPKSVYQINGKIINDTVNEAQKQHDLDIAGATAHAQSVMDKNMNPFAPNPTSYMPVMDQTRLQDKIMHLGAYKMHDIRKRKTNIKPVEVKK